MRNSVALRKFILPNLEQYETVQDLAQGVEKLVQDDAPDVPICR